MPEWKTLVGLRLAELDPSIGGDVVEEIAQHAEALELRLRAEGATDAAAREQVLAQLDDLAALARAARRSRTRRAALPASPPGLSAAWLRSIPSDFKYAVRLLAARPGFTAVAAITLALGIGANTALFSIVSALFVAPLPFSQPDRLVMVWETEAGNRENAYIASAPTWQDWTARTRSFEHTALWEVQSFNVTGGSEPEQVTGMRVTAGVFPMLGVAPQLGRAFTSAEEGPGHQVVVISDALWKRRFDGRPDAIGATLQLNRTPYEVIGIMPPGFHFMRPSNAVWVPIALSETDRQRDAHSFFAAARIRDGVGFEAARAEIEAVGRGLAAEHQANRQEGATITPMRDLGVLGLRPTLAALLAAVGVVLLIGCVNVANLMLAQAAARQREFAVRRALGAAAGRIASQLFAEGLLLAIVGGLLGVAFAYAGTSALSQSLPASIRFAPFRQAADAAIDARVLAFTGVVSLLTAILFSFAPMLGAARIAPGAALKSEGERGGTSRFGNLRRLLVAAEVCLAVIVLCGAGLMVKSVQRLLAVDGGIDPANVLLIGVALPQKDMYGPPERKNFCSEVRRELSALPGVTTVGAISHLPLSGANAGRGFAIEGRIRPEQGWSGAYRLTCPGYFASLGIRIVRGRDFNDGDTTANPGVVILNEETARRYFEGQNPLGQRIKLGRPDSEAPWLTIVGIAGDVRHFGLDSGPRREIFLPYSQAVWPSMTITVKTAVDPFSVAAASRAAVARVDPDLPISRMRTMDAIVAESIEGRRFPMLLLSLFSALALVLSAVGVYGVVSYVVSNRTRELAIRIALGASSRAVVRLVMAGALGPVGAGIVVGIAGAIASGRLLGSLLYTVAPSDPGILGSIAAVLFCTAAAACWVPARRAATVDPLTALKEM
jgi:putative ABC transport system permease protein